MRIKRNNKQKESALNAKFNPAKVLDIQIDVDDYRQYNSAMVEGVNPNDVQQIKNIYKEYEQEIEDIVASKIADMVPAEMIECIKELRRLECEVVNTKDLLGKKQIEKYHAKDDYKAGIIDAEIMLIKDELKDKKLELSKFIAKNKDVKLSLDLAKLDNDLRDNVQDMVTEIDDIMIALRTQINILKVLRAFVSDSRYIVERQLTERLETYVGRGFVSSIKDETPLLLIVSNEKILK